MMLMMMIMIKIESYLVQEYHLGEGKYVGEDTCFM